ncbi:hypothetical protein A6A03_15915 [Chloroflexus islandicus]|uniref:Uncharacterized protein n=1 Tax=Chloroflexus islandicus TaxID=1707952 RepID=A0A178MA04_9CHLR|nr:hypothetical protein A6A03_15915 [Chloroflexus islandicus]
MRFPGDAGAQWMAITQPVAPLPKWLQRRGAIIVTPAMRLPGDAVNAITVVAPLPSGNQRPILCNPDTICTLWRIMVSFHQSE